MLAQSSLAAGPRSLWATTSPAPITLCPLAAWRAFAAALASMTSSSSSPCRNTPPTGFASSDLMLHCWQRPKALSGTHSPFALVCAIAVQLKGVPVADTATTLSPAPRARVQAMMEYHPPLGSRDALRLDFNENTIACSPKVREVLAGISSGSLTRYPE